MRKLSDNLCCRIRALFIDVRIEEILWIKHIMTL